MSRSPVAPLDGQPTEPPRLINLSSPAQLNREGKSGESPISIEGRVTY